MTVDEELRGLRALGTKTRCLYCMVRYYDIYFGIRKKYCERGLEKVEWVVRTVFLCKCR